MTNRSRHHHRRRTGRTAPRIRGAELIDPLDAARRLDACTCPALITNRAGLVVIEHHHRHGCPQLDRPDRRA